MAPVWRRYPASDTRSLALSELRFLVSTGAIPACGAVMSVHGSLDRVPVT